MKQRLISAGVGIILLSAVLFLHQTIVFPLAMAAINGIILFELVRAVDGLHFKFATTGTLLYGIVQPFVLMGILNGVLFATYTRELVMTFFLTFIFIDYMLHPKEFTVEQGAFMIAAMILVPNSISILLTLNHDYDLFYVLLGLCGAWIADSGAYFSGVALGKRKLCPEISPKKTVEGFIGGLISNAVIFVLLFWGYAYFCEYAFTVPDMLKSALLGLVCAGISVLGDLTASVIKRQKGIKDYGNIMPGHGGLMDRFDSVLFVLPAFYTCITLFPIFD